MTKELRVGDVVSAPPNGRLMLINRFIGSRNQFAYCDWKEIGSMISGAIFLTKNLRRNSITFRVPPDILKSIRESNGRLQS